MCKLIEELLAMPKDEFISFCIISIILTVILIVGLTEIIKTIFHYLRK